jgi:hydroxymethylglutaryl-CoA synthase
MCLPSERIRVTEIANAWQQDGAGVSAAIGVTEKTVPGEGQDSFTLAYEAGKQAIAIAGIQPSEISAVFVGSESHPYAVKPTSGMVADALGVHPFCHAADLEFACKAGTAGLQIVDAFVRCKQIRYGLAIGSDTAQSKPGDALEYTAAAGAAAFVVGPDSAKNALCRIDSTLSFTTDTPDFWRAGNAQYPSHGGRFTGEPGYFHHVRTTVQGMLEQAKLEAKDLDHVVLHMPNGKFPSRIAKECGFTKEQMRCGFIVPHIGNTYSACSPIGLAHVLQEAKKDQRILLVSYGSGAGCDAFLFTMLRDGVALPSATTETTYVEYAEYRKRSETLSLH